MAAKKKAKATGRSSRKRRGTGESMTGANENQVEVRGPISVDDIDLPPADIQHHYEAMKTSIERKDTAVSNLRTTRKKADEACAGLADEIAHVIKLKRKNDPTAYARKMKVRNLVLSAMGFPVQLEIFDTLAGDNEGQVRERFYQAGKAGKGFECKYPKNSDLHAVAKEGWMRGQAELAGVDVADLTEGQEGEDGDGPGYDVKSPPNLPASATAH